MTKRGHVNNPARSAAVWAQRREGVSLAVIARRWKITPERTRSILWRENERRRRSGLYAFPVKVGTRSGLVVTDQDRRMHG